MDTNRAAAEEARQKMETGIEPARMTVAELKKRMGRKAPLFLIDTRGSDSWRESQLKLPGAVRIHYQDLDQHLDQVPRDRPIVAYCT